MKIHTMLLLSIFVALAAGSASADQMLIKYRSGNVQTLHLDESRSKIMSISYQDDKASGTDPSPSFPSKVDTNTNGSSDGGTATTSLKGAGTPPAKGKSSARIEWAQPLE